MRFAALSATLAALLAIVSAAPCNKKPWNTYEVTDLVVDGTGHPAATFRFTAPGIHVPGLGKTPDVDASCKIRSASNNWNNCDNTGGPNSTDYFVWANADLWDGSDGMRIQIQPKLKLDNGGYNGQAAAIFNAPLDNSVTEFEGDTYYFYCG